MTAEDIPPYFAVGQWRARPETFNSEPEIFSATTGQRFGDPTHFDLSCDGSLSIQFEGRKRWQLWAPWAVGGGAPYPAHTQFETVLDEGDVLFFPPGFYHTTHVLQGDSIAAAFYFAAPPVYGSLDPRSWRSHPLGYAACGWAPKAAEWEALVMADVRPASAKEEL